MATVNNETLVFYPAFCFKASPTHFTWVKMGAADVHRLRQSSDFVGQNIFFYNNHPIQFVSLVGVIVARTDIPRRTILTLDDSSGATIDITVLKKTSPKPSATSQATPLQLQKKQHATTATNLTQETHVTSKDHDEIDISALQPGTLVRVKGTLSNFRSQMQLHLERFWLVRDTNAEMQFLDTRLRFFIEVLSVPWVLTDEEIETLRGDAERCDERALENKRRAERNARKRVEREERHARAIARRYEREEIEREREVRKIREDGERVMRKFGFGGSG
ncbi:Nucleic acid-binding OB-fold [Penicillium samsonianum]|uniref:Nucleic acid-binding OB-fold n=1 Tax=Penicillium samsonianum TaxID=1882272 RepID=UPI002546C5AA|nr:Nucleic acid-binding OB-fold [Penicillium samsonianum]KAJ6128602.1 Nucleic acid-binding OB-fold [Penicillium samsonianum]